MKNLMKPKPDSRFEAFTLVEVLIAATIFTIVSLIAINVFVNVIRIQRRVQLENAIYEDARVMMERISREVRENTVDYEEYYNKALKQELPFASNSTLNGKNPYGWRYGCYAQRFYNPGAASGPYDGGFGAYCSVPPLGDPALNPDCIIDKTSLDINTGQNPYEGNIAKSDSTTANAFCDDVFGNSTSNTCGALDTITNRNEQNELYLISADGSQKTFFALKASTAPELPNWPNGEHALALLRLSGQDSDHDGVIETWRDDSGTACNAATGNKFCCSSGFDCKDADIPFSTSSIENTLNYKASNNYIGFIPISPTRTNIVSLKFFVAPLEDPRKAFAETDPTLSIQQQPHVTIVLTVQPSQASLSGYNGDVPSVTIQTTVTSRVYNEVKSYYTLASQANGICESY